jgi:hypothetical protein
MLARCITMRLGGCSLSRESQCTGSCHLRAKRPTIRAFGGKSMHLPNNRLLLFFKTVQNATPIPRPRNGTGSFEKIVRCRYINRVHERDASSRGALSDLLVPTWSPAKTRNLATLTLRSKI